MVALEKMEKHHLESAQKARLATLAGLCNPKVEKKVVAALSPEKHVGSEVLSSAGAAASTPPAASPAVSLTPQS
jgi:hypothetical protein